MRIFSTFLVLVLAASPAWAHKFKIFAFAEGNTIEGEAYFVGAGKASDAEVLLFQGERQVASVRSDENGIFQFKELTPASYLVKADAGQGHVANYSISADEMGGAAGESTPTSSPTQESEPVAKTDSKALSAIVERSVAHQLRPLRAQIEQLKDARRIQDILGGIGYIFGIAGLASLLLGRKRRQPDRQGGVAESQGSRV